MSTDKPDAPPKIMGSLAGIAPPKPKSRPGVGKKRSKKKTSKKVTDRRAAAKKAAKARGEPPLPRVRKPPSGALPVDLRVEDYEDAYQLYRAGLSPQTIGASLGLSSAQVNYLYQQGIEIDGVQLPSFRRITATKMAKIAEKAEATGEDIADKASMVLSKAMVNADAAATLMGYLEQHRLQKAALEMLKHPDARVEDNLVPTKGELAALRALRQVQDFTKQAVAFALVFGHQPGANRALVAAEAIVNGHRGRGDGSGDESPVPAAIALMTEKMGESVAIRLKEDILGAMSGWTPEQLQHFVLTGEEPGTNTSAPKPDVIDAEFEEHDPDKEPETA